VFQSLPKVAARSAALITLEIKMRKESLQVLLPEGRRGSVVELLELEALKIVHIDRSITVTTTFPALHCWPDAPEDVSFLRTPHRHLFHVTVSKKVSHGDRDIEFILYKGAIEAFLQKNWYDKNLGTASCEEMAEVLLALFKADTVIVSEDDENGAIVSVTK
jgi:hypothetical protein